MLIVEDNTGNRKFFCAALAKEDYNVDSAESGAKALNMIRDTRYNLVITDMHLDTVDGLSVLRAAKEKDKNTTGSYYHGTWKYRQCRTGHSRGAIDYLTKPVNSNAFLLHVNKALYDQEMDRQLEYQKRKIDEYHDMLDRDLAFAKKIQASLIPDSFSDLTFDFGICHIPMIRIGGDFGTIYKDTSANQVYLNILDVTGHGITAALVVNRICSEIGSLVRENHSPREILFAINSFFCDILGQTGMFLTMFSVRVEPEQQNIRIFGQRASRHPALSGRSGQIY
ncbi:MAG: response regulator [candidate division KSB1 bacterium]|nr:response regulator [candidate division KSB1 bacterium]